MKSRGIAIACISMIRNWKTNAYTLPTRPKQTKYEGIQTNEAPIIYLLKQHPDIDTVICLTTPQVLEPRARENGMNCSDFEWFAQAVRKENPKVNLAQVPIGEGRDLYRDVLPEILRNFHDSGTKEYVYLDTTGGQRDIITELTLIIRVLEFRKKKLKEAVYSNFQNLCVEIVTEQYRYFDLIQGMNDFTQFGSADKLGEYFDETGCAEGKALADAMRELNEAIILCRVDEIEEKLSVYADAFTAAEHSEDPLFAMLMPSFKESCLKDASLTGLIRWCVVNNRIQQAYTIYNERIPVYLVQSLNVFSARAAINRKMDYRSTQDEIAAQHFWESRNLGKGILTTVLGYELRYPDTNELFNSVWVDACAIKNIRNQFNHAAGEVRDRFGTFTYKKGRPYPVDLNETDISELKDLMTAALDRVEMLERMIPENVGKDT